MSSSFSFCDVLNMLQYLYGLTFTCKSQTKIYECHCIQLQNIAFILKKDGTWSREIKSIKSIYNTVFLLEMMSLNFLQLQKKKKKKGSSIIWLWFGFVFAPNAETFQHFLNVTQLFKCISGPLYMLMIIIRLTN